MTKTTLLKPKPVSIIDINEKPYKTKKEVEKVPEPTGFRIVLFPLLLQKKTKAGFPNGKIGPGMIHQLIKLDALFMYANFQQKKII